MDYFEQAESLIKQGATEHALYFIKKFEENEKSPKLLHHSLGYLYNALNEYDKAFYHYNELLNYEQTADIYATLGHIAIKLKKDSLDYFIKAYQIDDKYIVDLIHYYERKNITPFDYYETAISKGIELSDTDYFNYGAGLISKGVIQKGHEFLAYRHKDRISDIKDENLIIHYEEGFGDTLMYMRYIPKAAEIAKDVIFVVQKELLNIVSNQFPDIKVVDSIPELPSYKNLPLLDLPRFVKGDELRLKGEKTSEINSSKIKVGIAYKGAEDAKYSSRDLELEDFEPLIQDNIQLYSLQYGEDFDNADIINLGKDFSCFEDTINAILNMDCIITTDNVVLHLAGGLGVKTYAILKEPINFRWYKIEGEDIGWYKSVKPIEFEEMYSIGCI